MSQTRKPLQLHPGLGIPIKAKINKNVENPAYESVYSPHVPILITIPLQKSFLITFSEHKDSIQVISWNVKEEDSDNGLADDPGKKCGEEDEQIFRRHQRIAEALRKMSLENKADVIALQAINKVSSNKSLSLLIEAALRETGQEWNCSASGDEGDCLTFYRTDFFTLMVLPSLLSIVQEDNEALKSIGKKYLFAEALEQIGNPLSVPLMLARTDEVFYIHNFHAQLKRSPQNDERVIKNILKDIPDEFSKSLLTNVAVGNFGCTVLSKANLPNATTCVLPNKLNQHQQDCMSISGGFYQYHDELPLEDDDLGAPKESVLEDKWALLDEDKPTISISKPEAQQAVAYPLNPVTGRKFTHAELSAPLQAIKQISDAEDRELEQITRFYMAMSIEGNVDAWTLAAYERLLGDKIDDAILVRLATNACNQRGISMGVPEKVFNYIKQQNSKNVKLHFSIADENDGSRFYQISCAKYHLPILNEAMNQYCRHAGIKEQINAPVKFINICVELETPQPDGVKTICFKLPVLGGIESGDVMRCLTAQAGEIDFTDMEWRFTECIKLEKKLEIKSKSCSERSLLVSYEALSDDCLKIELRKSAPPVVTTASTSSTSDSSSSASTSSVFAVPSTNVVTPSNQGFFSSTNNGSKWNNSFTHYFRYYFAKRTEMVRRKNGDENGNQTIEAYWNSLRSQVQNKYLSDFTHYSTVREKVINDLLAWGRQFHDAKNGFDSIKQKALQCITENKELKQLNSATGLRMIKEEIMQLASDSRAFPNGKTPEDKFGPFRYLRARIVYIGKKQDQVKGYSRKFTTSYDVMLKVLDQRIAEIDKQNALARKKNEKEEKKRQKLVKS